MTHSTIIRQMRCENTQHVLGVLQMQTKKKQKKNLPFDPYAFPSSCCRVRTLIRSLKLKRPKDGRCDQTCARFYVFSSVCVITPPPPSSTPLHVFLYHCFIMPPDWLCGFSCLICLLMRDPEPPATHTHTYTPPPVNTFQIFLRPF